MKSAKAENRMCGVGGADVNRPGPARACGVGPGVSVGAPKKGSGCTIRPTRPAHRRSLDYVLRMGHCAPAVMAALLPDDDPGRENAVLLASAMAGGIGNSGRECGALTSSILYLGDRYGREAGPGGVPLSVVLSRRLVDRFGEVHGGIRCDEIRRGTKNPLPCMRAMVSAPELVREVIGGGAPGIGDACFDCHTSGLLAACEARSFHCVHRVFSELGGIVPECERLRDMTSPLVGGVALSGGTCAAAVAGVLAIGLATGRIENSYRRVVAMMAKMLSGGDMMADDVNDFNPAINRGEILMSWFVESYGSANCIELTGVDIRESETAGRYFTGGGIQRCEEIGAAVAVKTREIIEDRTQRPV